MGPLQRAIRRAVNPISTRVTMLVQGAGARRAFRSMPRGSATYGWEPTSSRPRPGSRPTRGAVAPRGDVVVPDVIGLGVDEARSILLGTGLVPVGPDPDAAPPTAAEWPDGVVVDQHPRAGTVRASGSVVTVWIEQGPGSAGVREPRRPRPAPRAASGTIEGSAG